MRRSPYRVVYSGIEIPFRTPHLDITDLVNAKVKAGEVTEVDALTAPFLGKLAKEELEKSDLKGKPGIEVKSTSFSMREINSTCSITKCTVT